jgi:hypothetical protein
MASKVQIAKLALQHVGDRYDISDITEATPEAEQVNLLYARCDAASAPVGVCH